VSAFGLCNHNLHSAGCTSINVQYYSGGWQSIGVIGIGDDRDRIVFFGNTGSDRYKITMNNTSSAFRIGYIYWGNALTLSVNPIDGLFVQTRRTNQRYIDTAGGGVHVVSQSSYPPGELVMSFPRMSGSDLNYLMEGAMNKIIGVLPPEYATDPESAPTGQDVFWGRITNIIQATRSPGSVANSTQVYDVTINMRSAV
jgi:hypothetical protein